VKRAIDQNLMAYFVSYIPIAPLLQGVVALDMCAHKPVIQFRHEEEQASSNTKRENLPSEPWV